MRAIDTQGEMRDLRQQSYVDSNIYKLTRGGEVIHKGLTSQEHFHGNYDQSNIWAKGKLSAYRSERGAKNASEYIKYLESMIK